MSLLLSKDTKELLDSDKF